MTAGPITASIDCLTHRKQGTSNFTTRPLPTRVKVLSRKLSIVLQRQFTVSSRPANAASKAADPVIADSKEGAQLDFKTWALQRGIQSPKLAVAEFAGEPSQICSPVIGSTPGTIHVTHLHPYSFPHLHCRLI